MRPMRFVPAAALVLVGVCYVAAFADERILRFHSDVMVHADSSLTATETIAVRCEGKQIKRGIYRDFPTRYRDKRGLKHVVGVEVAGVERDGKREPWHTKPLRNGVRVYFGHKDRLLKHGEHTYAFTYNTTYQLGFFDKHDELYWNVTGNDWDFPIDAVSATVRLPERVSMDAMALEGYTGPKGATGQDYEAQAVEAGVASFKTTRGLRPEEGLTVVVGFPKGIAQPPAKMEAFVHRLRYNASGAVGHVGILLVLGYYTFIWLLVGKDPAKGLIVPREAPPEGFSPAALRYVQRMAFDNKTFTAALISMAAKGYIRIEEKDGEYYLVRDQADEKVLAKEEKKVADALLAGRGEFKVDQEDHAKLTKAKEACKKALAADFEKRYFFTNSRYLVPGVVLSIITVVAAVLTAGVSDETFVALFMCVWLSGWTAGCAALLTMVIGAWRGVFATGGRNAGSAVGLTLFSIPFLAGECFGIVMLTMTSSATAVVAIVALGVLNVVFYQLLKAPTALGRKLLDELEGFCMTLRGQGQFRIAGEPEKAAEVYEYYLPYAIALGSENGWSEQFTYALKQAGASPRDDRFQPAWYTGPHWRSHGADGFAGVMGGALAGAVAASSTAPGSSSGGGGGGSSGGGGGGGGGGGW